MTYTAYKALVMYPVFLLLAMKIYYTLSSFNFYKKYENDGLNDKEYEKLMWQLHFAKWLSRAIIILILPSIFL